jgi:hypothetical protein
MPIGLKGNTDGSGAVQIGGSDAITISTGLNTTFAGTVTATGTVAGSTGTLYPLTSGTAVASTSGTALDFTGIPSWVKRITVMFSGVSTNGTGGFFVQLGTASGIETSGYAGSTLYSTSATPTAANMSSGFGVAVSSTLASNVLNGVITIALVNASTNTWAEQGTLGGSDNNYIHISAGVKSLAGTLSQVRITGGGTNTFDAGSINILFE